ncbi:MAG: cation diffusion facilitator family transporter [Coprococcus sp.]
MKISAVSIIANIVLSLAKAFAGFIAHSSAMISDAVHSASDVFSTIIVIIGVNIAGKESDEKHPYGHERFECVASIILADVLFLTGIAIGYSGLKTIISGKYTELAMPGILALIAAIVSIIVKELMFWYTRAGAKKINSGALMADAWHHRSDALSSVGALIGIGAARLGYPVMDSIASIVICIFILIAALDIFKDAFNKMVDSSCDEETINAIREIVHEQNGVKRVDSIMTRQFGNKAYVDVEISVDGDMRLTAAHEIAEAVHHAIESNFPQVKHCMVHVNPYE